MRRRQPRRLFRLPQVPAARHRSVCPDRPQHQSAAKLRRAARRVRLQRDRLKTLPDQARVRVLAALVTIAGQKFWILTTSLCPDARLAILSRRSVPMLRFQHERACLGKTGRAAPEGGSFRRRSAGGIAARARLRLAAAVPVLPRPACRRQRSLCAVLVETVLDRATILHAAWNPLRL